MTLGAHWHGENRPLRQQRCIFRLSEALSPSNRGLRRMHMQFSRITSFVDLQIWNATSDGFSFVISFSSRSGPGFRGRLGFVASWRPIYQNRTAIKVGGSPFKTLAEAEKACTTMLVHLIRDSDRRATPPV
jgi:hypothetical protein